MKRCEQDTLPQRWLEGGASDPQEARAGRLLARALGAEEGAAHPAVGSRIALRIESRRPHARGRLHTLMAVAAAASALVVVLASLRAPVEDSSHENMLITEGSASLASTLGRSFAAGDVVPLGAVLTMRDGGGVLALGTRAHLTAGPRTSLRLDGASGVEIFAGRALFRVRSLTGGERFVVRAGAVEIEVVGTVFEVAVDAGQPLQVSVSEGTVRVRQDRREQSVHSGQVWRGLEPATPTVEAVASTPPPKERKLEPSRRVPVDARPVPETQVAASFQRALGLTKSGAYEEAHRLYADMGDANHPSAETALYLKAGLETHQFNNAERALATLNEMARRFPVGILRIERELTRIEILWRMADCEELQASVVAFRAANADATALLGADFGDCAEQEAPSHSRPDGH